MNFLNEKEVSAETITYILRRQIKENKRYARTIPFHSTRACSDKTRCAFHRRRV